jgi:hypothetical protein
VETEKQMNRETEKQMNRETEKVRCGAAYKFWKLLSRLDISLFLQGGEGLVFYDYYLTYSQP